MQENLTLEEIEERLKKLSVFALRQVARAVGVETVARYKVEELRQLVLGVAKGEVEQVPEEKRQLSPETMTYNGDIATAVLKLRAQNKN